MSAFFPRFFGVIFYVFLAVGGGQLSASSLFFEPFSYTVGDPLTGQGDGTGFGGAWSGGSTTITSAPLAPGANSVAIGNTDPAFRELSTTYSTAGNSYYVAFLCSLSNTSGAWAGVSFFSGGDEKLFFGIPLATNALGSDYPRTRMAMPIEQGTTYLVAYSVTGTGDEAAGNLAIKMWATTDLGVDPAALVSGIPSAESQETQANCSFDRIRLAGDYEPGAMKIQGLNAATTLAEAVNAAVGKNSTAPSH